MTKSKRVLLTLLIFFALGIGVLLVALPTSSVVYAAAETDETVEATVEEEKGWGAWVKEELVPYAVLAISAIGTIIIGVSPILAKVKKASDKFKDAANDVNGTRVFKR